MQARYSFFFSLNIPFSILLHRQFLHFVSLFVHISMLYLVFAYMFVICVNIPGPRPFIGKITASTLINCIRNHRNDFGHFGKATTNKTKITQNVVKNRKKQWKEFTCVWVWRTLTHLDRTTIANVGRKTFAQSWSATTFDCYKMAWTWSKSIRHDVMLCKVSFEW